MNILVNIIVTLSVVFICIVAILLFFNKKYVEHHEFTIPTFDELCAECKQVVNDFISVDIRNSLLSAEEKLNQEEQRRDVSRCVRTCCSGNTGSKEVVKELIYNYLSRDRELNDSIVERIIPFSKPAEIPPEQLMEIAIYNHNEDGLDLGFKRFFESNNLLEPKLDKNDNYYFEVTEEDLRRAYSDSWIVLNYSDKLNILTQLVFAKTFGLGIIDTLNYQKGIIEEIQLGLTGLQRSIYNYKEQLVDGFSETVVETPCYSRESIHVLIRGSSYRLKFLKFESDEEMQRVLRNLIKDSSAGELTVKNPEIIVETIDDRRLTVSRPPMTDSWAGLIRKFDSLAFVTLHSLYPDLQDSDLLLGTIENIMRCGMHVAITGEMATGKTTMFRACLMETRPDLAIRVIESESFELNTRRFLAGRNTLAMRVTEDTPEDEILAFARKTTGQIFVIGEINSLAMANLAINVSKFSEQTMFSAHYISTEGMVSEFTNARLCVGGYTDEMLAEMDAVRALNFDIHLRRIRGRRFVSYINEIVPDFDSASRYNNSNISGDSKETVMALREIRTQLGKIKCYSVRPILSYDEDSDRYVVHNKPSKACFEKAKWFMSAKQYKEFCDFFDVYYEGVGDTNEVA